MADDMLAVPTAHDHSVVAVFADHPSADAAIRKLAAAGYELKRLSVVGQGYHSDEKVVGFYTTGDRIKLWGERGAFWGGLWGLLFGGVLVSLPVVGNVVVLGYLATAVISAIEGAVVVGGVSALFAGLYSMGIPKHSAIAYETAIKSNGFLVLASGSKDDVARAKAILDPLKPSRLDVHEHAAAQQAIEPVAVA